MSCMVLNVRVPLYGTTNLQIMKKWNTLTTQVIGPFPQNSFHHYHIVKKFLVNQVLDFNLSVDLNFYFLSY